MASTLDDPPVARTLDVEDLVKQAWAGHIRVPHFQRDFRWNWEDVRRLFDSIIKGYPIGSLLLWQRAAKAAPIRLGALNIQAPELDSAFWVVDGQQRLISLANALHPDGAADPRFGLAYDLKRSDLVKPSATFNPFVIPLPVFFDLQQLLKWFAQNPQTSEYLDQATALAKALRQYEAPAYLVQSNDATVLQDIFDRMNNYGRRLRRAEVFTALNASEEQLAGDARTLEGIAEKIDEDLSFGLIDSDTVLACILARRGVDVRRDIRREFDSPGDEGLNAAYKAGEEAMLRAVQFLQLEVGVPHYTFMAYRYLLVVLTRVFALFPEIDARNLRLLRRWYWQAAVGGPETFKGGTPNAARILCGRVSVDDSTQDKGLTFSVFRLLDAVSRVGRRIPDARRFSSNDANAKMLLCAMWALSPRDPVEGGAYTNADLARSLTDTRTAQQALRHLIPHSLVPEAMRPWACNRAIMPGLEIDLSDLGIFFDQAPLDLDSDSWELVRNSHLVPSPNTTGEPEPWRDVESYLKARQVRIEQHFEDYLAAACEWNLENTPPLSTLNLDDD